METANPWPDEMRVAPAVAPVRQLVARGIREAIYARRVLPGQRLIERELCEATGASRTSVREALRQLEAEGLVTTVPHRGPVVASVTRQEAEQLYELRAVLEGFAAELFARRASDEQIAELTGALDGVARALRSDPVNALRAKAEFYGLLLRGARNDFVRQALDALHGRVTYLRSLSLQRPARHAETVRELGAMVEAIAARDAAAARAAAEAHVRAALEALSRVFDDG